MTIIIRRFAAGSDEANAVRSVPPQNAESDPVSAGWSTPRNCGNPLTLVLCSFPTLQLVAMVNVNFSPRSTAVCVPGLIQEHARYVALASYYIDIPSEGCFFMSLFSRQRLFDISGSCLQQSFAALIIAQHTDSLAEFLVRYDD